MIELLRRTYDLYTYPTLIIEGDKYEGFKDKAHLLDVICDYYKGDMAECDGFQVEE